MYIERWLIVRKMFIALHPTRSHHYDPLHICSRRSSPVLQAPFLRPQRRLQTQKLAFYSSLKLASQFARKGLILDPFRDSNSRDGALSQRSSRAFMHLGGAQGFHVQMHSFSSWNELVSRDLSSREFGVCRVLIYRDDALSRRAYKHPSDKGRTSVRSRAFNPQNGGRGGGGGGRIIFNLAAAGLLTYLTVTGGLNWFFDSIISLWLISAVLWWFVERSLIKGPCPNCGGEFQVFGFSLDEEQRLCPYCSQPFKLENKKFVREEPQFSNEQTQGFKQPFGGGFRGFEGFGQPTSSRKKEDNSGVIVDIEAEVRDKD